MTTPHDTRSELLRILSMTDPFKELAALRELTGTPAGPVPFASVASAYLTFRPFDLDAIANGFAKSGNAVLAFVDALKERAGCEPTVHQVEDDRVCVWLWRTQDGPKLVVFQRAPGTPTIEGDNVPERFLYSPDWWRQLKAQEIREHVYMLADSIVTVCEWEIPPRSFDTTPPPVTSTEARTQIKCAEPACEAATAAECTHKTLEEAVGFRFPTTADLNPTPPSEPVGSSNDEQESTPDYEETVSEEAERLTTPAPVVVHCSGAWVPPCTEAFACSPSPTKSRRVYTYTLDGDQQLRDKLPGVTCPTCREVMGAVMEAGKWCGPNLDPTSRRGWIVPSASVGPLLGTQGRRDELTGGGGPFVPLDPTAPDDIQANPDWDPTKPGNPPEVACANCSHVGKHHDHKTKKCAECGACPGFWPSTSDEPQPTACTHHHDGACVDACPCPPECNCHPCPGPNGLNPDDVCPCGHKRDVHDGDCGACACVVFRVGAPVAIESNSDRAAYIAKRDKDYALSLDMEKITKQRTAKAYAQCQICKAMIGGPTKDDAGKITTQGDQWVGPKLTPAQVKKKKTVSMRHRAHVGCADAALESYKVATA